MPVSPSGSGTTTVTITEQVAVAAVGPVVCLTEQSAVGPSTAVVVLSEQHADSGGGSKAAVRVVDQRVSGVGLKYGPSAVAASKGEKQWFPQIVHVSIGTGAWR